jgi:hypothetical protein
MYQYLNCAIEVWEVGEECMLVQRGLGGVNEGFGILPPSVTPPIGTLHSQACCKY